VDKWASFNWEVMMVTICYNLVMIGASQVFRESTILHLSALGIVIPGDFTLWGCSSLEKIERLSPSQSLLRWRGAQRRRRSTKLGCAWRAAAKPFRCLQTMLLPALPGTSRQLWWHSPLNISACLIFMYVFYYIFCNHPWMDWMDLGLVLWGIIGDPEFVANLDLKSFYHRFLFFHRCHRSAKAGSEELRGMAAFGEVRWKLRLVGPRWRFIICHNMWIFCGMSEYW
jgi:hypothetical protein